VEVTVLLFAALAEQTGTRRIALECDPGATVATVRDRVVALYPQAARFLPTLVYAVNEEYAKVHETIPAGATVALIPPVSGG
jgi:molybdopterin converting factor subunit 1